MPPPPENRLREKGLPTAFRRVARRLDACANADPLALDQRDDVLHHACAHDRIEGGEWLVHQDQPWLHGQHLCKRDTLALAAAEVTGKAIAEARKAQPLKPGLRLGERVPALHSVQCEAERHVVARRLPGQQGIVLEQQAELRACKVRLDCA